jgi:hypothetical protein
MKRTVVLLASVLSLSFSMGASALNKKLTKKSYMDARHCLELATNTEVIKCAEKFM